MFRWSFVFSLCVGLVGCATAPPPTPASRQQAEADLVILFQSWNSIAFIKPDITATAGAMPVRTRTFSGPAFEKLLRNLKTPRGFVVVVLDRRYRPDPAAAHGGMDALEQFFAELGFHRIAFQDGGAWRRPGGLSILKDIPLRPPTERRQPG